MNTLKLPTDILYAQMPETGFMMGANARIRCRCAKGRIPARTGSASMLCESVSVS